MAVVDRKDMSNNEENLLKICKGLISDESSPIDESF